MTTPATRRQYRNNSRTDLDLRAGELLATRRVTMNMSQGEVAEEWARVAGVARSQVTVTNYETGRTPLTLSQLFQVCEVLGMSPATVLELGTTVDRDGRHPWTTPRVILPPVSDRPRVQ